MYRKPKPQLTIDDFILPFSGKLNAENRWVQLAKIIPWDEFEKEYAFMFRVIGVMHIPDRFSQSIPV